MTVNRVGPEEAPLAAHTVIGERYEVREGLRRDGLSRSYLAFDQEAEEAVLLRLLARDLVSPGEPMRAVLGRLRPKLGLGGRYLAGPIDADIEDDRLYVIEPLPRGVPLSAVMRRRTSDERSFGAKEVLPVLAQVAAALAAIPPPHAHLEVTPRQIWIDSEGLMLTGPFLLGCLEPAAIARVLERDAGLGSTAAPELEQGSAGSAADVFAVGRLAHLMLLPSGEEPSALTLGPVADAISRLTKPDRGSRLPSLDPLIEGLARLGGLPVPELDTGAYRRTASRRRPSQRALALRDEVSAIDPRLVRAAKAADAASDIDPRLLRAARSPELAARTREVEGAASGGTQEISIDQIIEEAPAEDDLDGLDPRLVRAALDMELDEDVEEELSEELDELLPKPEPTRLPPAPAAPAMIKPAREATQEVTLDQIVDEVPNRPDLDSIDPALLRAALAPKTAPPTGAKRGAPETMELTLEDLQAEATPLAIPAGVKPLPRARRASSPGLAVAAPALYDDSRSLPAIDAEMLARVRSEKAPVGSLAARGRARRCRGPEIALLFRGPRRLAHNARGAARSSVRFSDRTLARLEAGPTPTERPAGHTSAKRVMLLSVVLGLLMILASLGYAAYRHRAASQERQRRLEERYQQLQEEAQGDRAPDADDDPVSP